MSEMILSAIEKSKGRTLKEKVMRCILALQHLVAMFGATVLVPFLTGLDPSVALFTAGCGTLIFHLCTKGKVPVFLGSSFAFIPVIKAVNDAYGDLSYAQGGMFVASLYICNSIFYNKEGWSWKNKSNVTGTSCWTNDYGNWIKSYTDSYRYGSK